jgi:glycerophosphoryl diester phosphodiesterase
MGPASGGVHYFGEMLPEQWAPPVAIAHRGSRHLWPENTMEAFSGAVGLGYRFLETDLHVTEDDVVVCFHDETLDRTTDGAGAIRSHGFDRVRQLDAGHRHLMDGGYPFRGNGVRVPSLEEAVTTYPDVSFIVDLKGEGIVDPLVRLIDRLSLHHRLIVGSFSDRRLDEFRAATGDRVPTSSGPILSRLWLLTSRVGRAPRGQSASALQLPVHTRGVRVVDRRLIEAAHGNGLQVHVWTVNDPGEMAALLDIGVDGIITDRPDLLKELLVARGQWP